MFRRTYKYLPSIILILVAVVQLTLSYQFNLSPWKGGGFGMFSSVYRPESRYIKVYLETENKRIPAELPDTIISSLIYKTMSFPIKRNLELIAEKLLDLDWYYRNPTEKSARRYSVLSSIYKTEDKSISKEKDDEILYATSSIPNNNAEIEKPLDLDGISLELWYYKFDKDKNKLSGIKYMTVSKEKN